MFGVALDFKPFVKPSRQKGLTFITHLDENGRSEIAGVRLGDFGKLRRFRSLIEVPYY